MSISGALNLAVSGSFRGASVDSRAVLPANEPAAVPAEIENQDVSGQNSAPAPSRSLVDPANLSQAQEAAEETEETGEDGEPLTISARLVPVGDEDTTEGVALDGRPESVRSGELVSEAQRLTREPLEVPNYRIDPAERDIQVFNERINRSTDVLQFLNSRPSPRSSGGGVSIVV